MKKCFLIIGVPASGKSWVCEQVRDKFEYVHHDGYIGHINQPEVYVKAILDKVKSEKPLLAEAPFSISQIKDPLERAGVNVVPIFIQEHPSVLSLRYVQRERKQIPQGHITRQETYAKRAREWRAFQGTSTQVLEHLLTHVTAP